MSCSWGGAATAAGPSYTTNKTMETKVSAEMPRYQSHKKVHALKIDSIEFDRDKAKAEGRETDGSAIITPADDGYAPFRVDALYVNKRLPAKQDVPIRGYYVVYKDGYKSWSPAEAFEEGYTKVGELAPHQKRVVDEREALSGKANRLWAFIERSEEYKALPREERILLERQLRVMGEYSDVLRERIAAF